jgi:hypothetical protein
MELAQRESARGESTVCKLQKLPTIIKRYLLSGSAITSFRGLRIMRAKRDGVMEQKRKIEIGSQVYLEEGGDPCGAVRDVRLENRDEITIYVENSGEFIVSLDAVGAAHDGKVILDRARLDQSLLDAVAHAHDAEVPGL